MDIEIDSRVERLIWKSIGRKSVRKIAEETGLSVEQVAFIRTELLDGVDELSIDQKRTRLLVDLQAIADRASDDYEEEPDKDKGSKLLTVAVGAIKTVLQEMRQMEKSSSGAIDALNQMRVRELTSLVDEVIVLSVTEISEVTGRDEAELMLVFQRNLEIAALKRDRVV